MAKVDRRVAKYIAVDPGASHTGLAWVTFDGQPFCQTLTWKLDCPNARVGISREIWKLVDVKRTRAIIVEDFVVRPRGAKGTDASRPLKFIGCLELLAEPSKVRLVIAHPKSRTPAKRLYPCWPTSGRHDEDAAGHLQSWLNKHDQATLQQVRSYGDRALW